MCRCIAIRFRGIHNESFVWGCVVYRIDPTHGFCCYRGFVSMKPVEVILSGLMAIFTTLSFTIITYFYRLALPNFDDVAYNTLYNMLEVTADKVVFVFLGSFVMYLLLCKWLDMNYKRNVDNYG